MRKIFLFSLLGILGLIEGLVAYATTCPEISLGKDWCPTTPADYFSKIYQIALGFGVILALAMIIYGGILYATARESAVQQKEARDQITQALLGLIILFASVLILRTINPELVNLGGWEQKILPAKKLSPAEENKLSEICARLQSEKAAEFKNCKDKYYSSFAYVGGRYLNCVDEVNRKYTKLLKENGCR